MDRINTKGLTLIGCGFMGTSLLKGWLSAGLSPSAVSVHEPNPSEWLKDQSEIALNPDLASDPAIVIIATKPQLLGSVLPELVAIEGRDTIFLSIAAGAPISLFESHLGANRRIIRAMPNLPSAIGQGATAICANASASGEDVTIASQLFEAVGSCVVLPDEDLLHLVTGLSGSGPAYIFAMAEAMSAAAVALGLPAELANPLAKQTIAGAGAMLAQPQADAEQLRKAVTSKGGTTAAGLQVLTPELEALMMKTIEAAMRRSEALSN